MQRYIESKEKFKKEQKEKDIEKTKKMMADLFKNKFTKSGSDKKPVATVEDHQSSGKSTAASGSKKASLSKVTRTRNHPNFTNLPKSTKNNVSGLREMNFSSLRSHKKTRYALPEDSFDVEYKLLSKVT